MPITKQKSHQTSDGKLWGSLDDARQHELTEFLKTSGPSTADSAGNIALLLVQNADKIVDLLTTKASSRPAARKVNRKKKGTPVDANDPNRLV